MIRKYSETEIPRLLEIWEAAALIAHPFLSNDFHEMVKKAMKEMYLPNSDTWVYEASGNILGFIAMLDNEIGGLFVDPNQQAKGIGTALVNQMHQLHDTLEVEVFEKNKIGKPFYEKYGFKVIKTYVMEATNEKVIRMRK
jgi:putative acetyltransferase